MYIVRPGLGPDGSNGITNDALFSTITNNIEDKALRFDAPPVPPSVAAPGTGALALIPDATSRFGNSFFQSLNGESFLRVGDVTGVLYEQNRAPRLNSISIWGSATTDALDDTSILIEDGLTFSYQNDARQIFNPGANNPGVNVGQVAPDPLTPVNGDLWYNSATNQLMARINGVNVPIGNFSGIPRAFPPNTTTVGNVGSGPTVLHLDVLPANSLRNNGDYAHYTMAGGLAPNTNTKGIGLIFNGGAGSGIAGNIIDVSPNVPINGTPPSLAFTVAGGWRMTGDIVRKSATTFILSFVLFVGVSKFDLSGTNTGKGSFMGNINWDADFTSGGVFNFATSIISLNTIGIGVANNDVTQNLSLIEVFNF